MIVVRPIDWGREWAPFLSFAFELAPLTAGLLARRSLREPAMQIAGVWGLFLLVDIWTAARYHGLVPVGLSAGPLVLPLHALLTPALLTWAGGTLARHRRAITLAMLVAVVVPMLWFADEREYRLYVRPLAIVVLGAFALLALARTVQRTQTPLRAQERFVICIGLTAYLLMSLLWPPLLETTFAISRPLARAVNLARLTLEMLVSALIAFAVYRRGRAEDGNHRRVA